ncbi:class A beta-lactamase [Agromyces aerolatus]|uniref:class A beta-lactamase n=1 Tax=Agromyces sp. LY-1074 TaxID=3074080 RepID=UPI00285C119F|nr:MULTISPECIES: class A beta-lactamase [unclassified Agromyces]MDR5699606.1 class A beta-lactamase [Agromyces sp. LY-1074]MDR5705902.1 class A beta-lactamase [Agromyces sp. LY-1358]
MTAISRRALLSAALVLPLAGCAVAVAPAPSSAPSPAPTPRPSPTRLATAFTELETEHDARFGLFAMDTGTGRTLAHRAGERFAFCSTFKALAAAAILNRPDETLDTLITYRRDDLVGNAPITEQHVDTGMTLRDLCDAAVRFSDGPAGNLLVRELGGPAALTEWARSLGDDTFRMDRVEPDLTEATPGDPRDTTTPEAFATTIRALLLGDALRPEASAALTDLMLRNTTGDARIRAGTPAHWLVAERTGSGGYGTANDIGVVWPADASPIALAIMTSRPRADDERSDALIAEAARLALTELAGEAGP